VTVSLSAFQTRALILDIEGTTTPIEFVYDVLFPYARAHAAEYLARNRDSTECQEAIALLRKEARAAQPDVAQDFGATRSDVAQGFGAAQPGVAQDFSPAKILEYVFSLMDHDKKSPGLKVLQGLIWRDVYQSGELRGQVFPDVVPAFERWRARRLDLYIYSSGSVLAQRLLFGSTDAGDVTRFLKGYFDTEVGPKTSADSYRAISERIHVAPTQTLFVSDVVQELDAALSAGLRTVLCVRPTADLIRSAAQPHAVGTHQIIQSFDEIVG